MKMEKEFNLSEKECNIIINKIDLNKYQTIGALEIRGKEQLAWEKGFFKSDIKEFIKKLLTPNNISKGFVEISTIKYYAGKDLI